jgi:5'(3')-deoxyribonucleotidase
MFIIYVYVNTFEEVILNVISFLLNIIIEIYFYFIDIFTFLFCSNKSKYRLNITINNEHTEYKNWSKNARRNSATFIVPRVY